MNDLFVQTIVAGTLVATIRIATPLMIAALGELITERAGILNLSVEGTMIMGAFVGFVACFATGSLAIGVLAAMLAGMLMGSIFALMVVTLKVDQIIAGIAMNILASGLSLYCYTLYFNTGDLPVVSVFPVLPIPFLSEIPLVGEALFSQKLPTYIGFALVALISFFLYRTRSGLELRCLGENPRVIDTAGLSVTLRQYGAILFGSACAGLAGAVLTIAATGRFVPDMVAGRGWLAIVIVIAGNWQPGRIMIASIAFACLDALQLQAQSQGINVPYQLMLALPYIAALILMIGNGNRSRGPAQLGVAYTRE